jgi:hypothetical protein
MIIFLKYIKQKISLYERVTCLNVTMLQLSSSYYCVLSNNLTKSQDDELNDGHFDSGSTYFYAS